MSAIERFLEQARDHAAIAETKMNPPNGYPRDGEAAAVHAALAQVYAVMALVETQGL